MHFQRNRRGANGPARFGGEIVLEQVALGMLAISLTVGRKPENGRSSPTLHPWKLGMLKIKYFI